MLLVSHKAINCKSENEQAVVFKKWTTMDIDWVIEGILVIIYLDKCVCLHFEITSCCYSCPPYLLGMQKAYKYNPLFPRRWGNQPWHTREALICHLLLSGNGWKLNEHPHAFYTALRKWTKYLNTDSRPIYLSPQASTQSKVLIL